MVNISKEGLNARNKLDKTGTNETAFLDILEEIITSGTTPAEKILKKFSETWNGNVNKLIKELSY